MAEKKTDAALMERLTLAEVQARAASIKQIAPIDGKGGGGGAASAKPAAKAPARTGKR